MRRKLRIGGKHTKLSEELKDALRKLLVFHRVYYYIGN